MFLKTPYPLTRQARTIVSSILILAVFFFYDILLDGVLSLLHSVFEFIELALDSLVEHFFHTSPHTTEMIVFYILVVAFGFFLYTLVRAIPQWFSKLKEELIGFYWSETTTVVNFWQSRSVIEKGKYSALCVTGTILFILWLFS